MKSYPIVYQGDIATALNNIGITDFMILNDLLAVAYVADDFNGDILDNTYEVAWYQESKTMSTMIEINENIEGGERVATAAGTNFIEDNPYINLNGKDVLIGIIDSGIDYLHPDFINEDNTSKIISIWDQESEVKPPPEGMIFGSEFTRDDINQAISNNDDTLTKDNIGTGTIAAGIAVGNGRVNELYRGVALGSELIVVKLRQYEGTFKEGRINYINTDFLAGIKYILDVAQKEDKYLIINLTLGQRPRSLILTTLLNTFQEIRGNGVFVVSGAGNEGNTDVHYEGSLQGVDTFQDVILEVGEQKSLDITIALNDPGRVGVEVISPSGEISYKVEYAPDNEQYEGEYLRTQETRLRHQNNMTELKERDWRLLISSAEACDPALLYSSEVQDIINSAISELSDQAKTVFILSRYEGLSNADIAVRLGIAPKTVEYHITKALKIMRLRLKDYLPLILFFI